MAETPSVAETPATETTPTAVPDARAGQSAGSLPPDALIIVPVRDTVLFPGIMLPITIGRQRSIAAAQQAVREQRQVGILMQRDSDLADPAAIDMHRMGTVANVARYLTGPDGAHHLVCQGEQRFQVVEFLSGWPFLVARVLRVPEPLTQSAEIEARMLHLREQAAEAVQLLPQAPPELLAAVQGAGSPGVLADLVTTYMDVTPEEKQEILETIDLNARMEKVARLLAHRIEVMRLSREIGLQTKAALDERQREVLLREQMAAIQRQLGEGDEGKAAEMAELDAAITKAQMPKEVEEQARKELRRLQRMPEAAAEHGMVRAYLDWLIRAAVGATRGYPDRHRGGAAHPRPGSLRAREDQGGSSNTWRCASSRRTEKRRFSASSGRPASAKTSLGQSIARAMNRKFVRVSLGGVHDEAEIRGHRRTYIGALPGNIIQAIRKSGSRTCVMMLDEIDKVGTGIHGDPSSALLEVLDPEQNNTFRDNYLAVPFDLSRVVFITTANMLDTIPGPLRDRMEIISLTGYTAEEKLQIARRYLVRRQLEANGLQSSQVEITEEALRAVIHSYTREAGVRSLEREIGKTLRHAAVRIAEGQAGRSASPPVISPAFWVRRNSRAKWRCAPCAGRGDRACLDAGRRRHPVHRGDPHSGQRKIDSHRPARRVMRESAQAALGIVKNRAGSLGIDEVRMRQTDIHIHIPAGAIEGRTECRRRHIHGPGLAADRAHCAQRHRHDGRDQPARAGVAGRRHQEEDHCRPPCRYQARDVAGPKPKGLRGYSEEVRGSRIRNGSNGWMTQ